MLFVAYLFNINLDMTSKSAFADAASTIQQHHHPKIYSSAFSHVQWGDMTIILFKVSVL
jgi:hypothetical protein